MVPFWSLNAQKDKVNVLPTRYQEGCGLSVMEKKFLHNKLVAGGRFRCKAGTGGLLQLQDRLTMIRFETWKICNWNHLANTST